MPRSRYFLGSFAYDEFFVDCTYHRELFIILDGVVSDKNLKAIQVQLDPFIGVEIFFFNSRSRDIFAERYGIDKIDREHFFSVVFDVNQLLLVYPIDTDVEEKLSCLIDERERLLILTEIMECRFDGYGAHYDRSCHCSVFKLNINCMIGLQPT